MAGALRHPEPGGSRRLVELIERYGEAIEADLAFRGWDLAQLWRQRRWRFLLNLIDHLPRGTNLSQAVADDDELAERRIARGEISKPGPPPVSEFTPDVEVVASLYDLVGALITTVAASQGAKNPPKPKPYPRPRTAYERAMNRAAQAEAADIVAKVLPHKRDDRPD